MKCKVNWNINNLTICIQLLLHVTKELKIVFAKTSMYQWNDSFMDIHENPVLEEEHRVTGPAEMLNYPSNYKDYLQGEDLPYWKRSIPYDKVDRKLIIVDSDVPFEIKNMLRERLDVIYFCITGNKTLYISPHRCNEHRKNRKKILPYNFSEFVKYFANCTEDVFIYVVDYKNKVNNGTITTNGFIPWCGSVKQQYSLNSRKCKPMSKNKAKQICEKSHILIEISNLASRKTMCDTIQWIVNQPYFDTSIKAISTETIDCQNLSDSDMFSGLVLLMDDNLLNIGIKRQVLEVLNFLDLHIDSNTLRTFF